MQDKERRAGVVREFYVIALGPYWTVKETKPQRKVGGFWVLGDFLQY
jgi:hypothetical protein